MGIHSGLKKEKRASNQGYMILILIFFVFLITIGLMIATPIWQTQVKREKEDELIFRGNQYVEAIRIFQVKKPGAYPKDFDELIEEKCIRRLFTDPMTQAGEWNIILMYEDGPMRPGRRRRPPQPGGRGGQGGPQKVLVAPMSVLKSIENARIIGVVSSSTQKSVKLYSGQSSYDKWLFFYGQEKNKLPEIVYYGQEEKEEEDL